jgi:hypothetical protein
VGTFLAYWRNGKEVSAGTIKKDIQLGKSYMETLEATVRFCFLFCFVLFFYSERHEKSLDSSEQGSNMT